MSKITKEHALKVFNNLMDEVIGHYSFMTETVSVDVDGEKDEDGCQTGAVTVKFKFYEYENEPQFIAF